MSDIAKHDRAQAAQSAYLEDYDRSQQVRDRSREIAGNVFRNMQGKREIDIDLRLGAVCQWSSKADIAIWLEAIERLEAEGHRKGVR